jgi:hypothetical protein
MYDEGMKTSILENRKRKEKRETGTSDNKGLGSKEAGLGCIQSHHQNTQGKEKKTKRQA